MFLRWIAPPPALRWADIGCGNGAFSELLFSQGRAAHVGGVDPSSGQLEYARKRLDGFSTDLQLGTAAKLPFADASFDASAMALVIFFVPVPEAGVAEMVRVTKPGGTVAAYAWDIPGGGFPTEPVSEALHGFGIEPQRPPRADVSPIAALERLWIDAGLHDVRSRTIEVEREFEDFQTWWSSVCGASSIAAAFDRLSAADLRRLQDGLRERLQPGPDGRVRCHARANAVAGTRAR